MAKRRRRRGAESISGYFRKIFDERPELLHSKSNAELVERWNADHPSNPATNRVRQNLANTKSVLRKKRTCLGSSLVPVLFLRGICFNANSFAIHECDFGHRDWRTKISKRTKLVYRSYGIRFTIILPEPSR